MTDLDIKADEETRDYARRVGSVVSQLVVQSEGMDVSIKDVIQIQSDMNDKQINNHITVMGALNNINTIVQVSATNIENTERAVDQLQRRDNVLSAKVDAIQTAKAASSSKTNWMFIGIGVAVVTVGVSSVAGWMVMQFLDTLATKVPS